MNPEDIKEILDALMQMGQSIAAAGFDLALRRTITMAIIDLVAGIILVIACPMLTVLTVRQAKKSGDLSWLLCFSAVTAGFLGLFMIMEALDPLLNPEWNAIQMIIHLVN